MYMERANLSVIYEVVRRCKGVRVDLRIEIHCPLLGQCKAYDEYLRIILGNIPSKRSTTRLARIKNKVVGKSFILNWVAWKTGTKEQMTLYSLSLAYGSIDEYIHAGQKTVSGNTSYRTYQNSLIFCALR